jgi:ATP-dependent helicase/nuclease subunit A
MGWLKITVPESKWTDARKTAAQAPAWDEKEATETAYLAAEHERLRYVAATRAKSELWISQVVGDAKTMGQWECFTRSLPSSELTELDISAALGRIQLSDTIQDIGDRLLDAESKRAVACEPSYTVTSVTQSAKETLITRAEGEGTLDASDNTKSKGRGKAWGRAVHRVIEAMGYGRHGEGLREFISAVVADEFASASDSELNRLTQSILSLASGLTASSEWRELMVSKERYFELPITLLSSESGNKTLVEGVIDAAGFDGESWKVFDWKTDNCEDGEWAKRLVGYQMQVDAYATMLSKLYTRPATGTIVRIKDPS